MKGACTHAAVVASERAEHTGGEHLGLATAAEISYLAAKQAAVQAVNCAPDGGGAWHAALDSLRRC